MPIAPDSTIARDIATVQHCDPVSRHQIALRVAHSLDLPLLVAGPVHPYPSHQAYFAEKVQPQLDQKRRYIGPVGLPEKIQLLAGAQALLIPSLVAETSSLVAMEAASAGTPVIAYRSGALPEVVVDRVTGFIVESEQQMAEAIKNVHEISAAECRAHARKSFDADRMATDYLQLYKRILVRYHCRFPTSRNFGTRAAPHENL